MELRENGIYRMDDRVLIAVTGDEGYILYTPAEWATFSTADFTTDADGRILFQGMPTGWLLAGLEDTGKTAGDDDAAMLERMGRDGE